MNLALSNFEQQPDFRWTEEAMRDFDIERIVYVPASELVSRESFHVHLGDGYLAEHIGRGETIAEAIQDACQRVRGRNAA